MPAVYAVGPRYDELVKRTVLRTFAFLILGAIVNVAVAHPSRRAGYGQAVGLMLRESV